MEGVPDDEISLSVLLYSVHGCSIFVVLGLSFMVAVGRTVPALQKLNTHIQSKIIPIMKSHHPVPPPSR
jgi:hypothetical protein